MNIPSGFLAFKVVFGALSLSGFGATLLLGAPSEKIVRAPLNPDPIAIEFLLVSATKEFRSSGTRRPTALRNARIGFLRDSTSGTYILCGSFKSGIGAEATWTSFATLKTSDYEHWVGGAALAIRSQKTIQWFPGDYSTALMQRLKD